MLPINHCSLPGIFVVAVTLASLPFCGLTGRCDKLRVGHHMHGRSIPNNIILASKTDSLLLLP